MKCSECKLCGDIKYGNDTTKWYFCQVDETWVSEEWAEDEDLECDFFDNNSNDDTTKRT